MASISPVVDPIRETYYRPLELAEAWGNVFFYIAAALSLIAPMIDRATHPICYGAVQLPFILAVVALCALGIATRLYFAPRARAKRYLDFLSSAYDIQLTDSRTAGYYNNQANEPLKRVAWQVLENSFHSKDTALRMAVIERFKVSIYVVLWLVVVLIRGTDLGIAVLAAQIVFSEQILSRWLRLEWLRTQFEEIFEELYRQIQSRPDQHRFEVIALEFLGRYEMAKANSGITLSAKIFSKRRDLLATKWENIKTDLSL